MKKTISFILLLTATLPAWLSAANANSDKILDKGMDAETIRSMYGQPAEVIALESDGMKAEKWIYRRKMKDQITQVETGVTMQPAFIGNSGTGSPMIGTAAVPEYRLKYFKVSQVTALLMVEGKLERAKQWTEREESFSN